MEATIQTESGEGGQPTRSGGVLRILGWLIAVVSALFVTLAAHRSWNEIAQVSLSAGQWGIVVLLIPIYGGCLLMLGLGWHFLLQCVDAGTPGPGHSLRAHMTSQLAKYVPGNVFHLLGRHMIHRAAGLDQKRLLLAALLENVFMLAGATFVAIACLAIGGSGLLRQLAMLAGVGLIVAAATALLCLRKRFAWSLAPALGALGASVAAFAVMASVVVALAAMLGAQASWQLGAGGIVSWIAGFVTPGAPGGLGVREAVMVVIGGRSATVDQLVLLALLFRLVTFCGDVLCAAVSRLVFRDAT